jgi:TIR domain
MDGKRRVQFFLSYAHHDRPLVDSFLAELEKQCSGAARYVYRVWRDGQILLGTNWRESIDRAIHACDFGLLLVSPAFLGSGFIRKHELPHFIGSGKKLVLPVGLAKVDGCHHDLQGIDEHQIFFNRGKAYGELRSAPQKQEFAFELFVRIQERLDAVFKHGSAA